MQKHSVYPCARTPSPLFRWLRSAWFDRLPRLAERLTRYAAGRPHTTAHRPELRRAFRPGLFELEPRLQPNDLFAFLTGTSVFGSGMLLAGGFGSLAPAAVSPAGAQALQSEAPAAASELEQGAAADFAFTLMTAAPAGLVAPGAARSGASTPAAGATPASTASGVGGTSENLFSGNWLNTINSIFAATSTQPGPGHTNAAGVHGGGTFGGSGASEPEISFSGAGTSGSALAASKTPDVQSASVALASAVTAHATGLSPRMSAPGAGGAGSAPAIGSGGGSQVSVAQANAEFGNVPVAFEPNVGQTDPSAKFLSRGPGFSFYLTNSSAVFVLPLPAGQGAGTGVNVLRLDFVGSSNSATAVGEQKVASTTNYLNTANPAASHANVPNYAEAVIQNIYPGIDVAFFGSNSHSIEYDFIVHPGANASAINLKWEGVTGLSTDAQGRLDLQTGAGTVVEDAPVAFQAGSASVQQTVPVSRVLNGDGTVGFQLGSYDRARDLVIDPVVAFSTYLGGNGMDQASGAAVDNSSGSAEVVVVGTTTSTNFPTTAGVIHPTWSGSGGTIFAAKFASGGSSLVYSTYLITPDYESGASAVAVDSAGAAYVAGTDVIETGTPHNDGLIYKINAGGSQVLYSVFQQAGPNSSTVSAFTSIAVDSNNQAYVTGVATSLGAKGKTVYHAFAMKYDSGGTLYYDTELSRMSTPETGDPFGGYGIAVDNSGNAFVTGIGQNASGVIGSDLWEVNSTGSFTTSGLLTVGNNGVNWDVGSGICVTVVNNSDYIYITGTTTDSKVSPTQYAFPRTSNAVQYNFPGTSYSAFVLELNSSFQVVYGTYLGGGNGGNSGNGIAVDGQGNITVVGQTSATNLPTTNALQSTFATNANTDGFVAQIDGANLSAFNYCTYWGGNGTSTSQVDQTIQAVALDPSGNVYIAGYTSSASFPTQSPVQSVYGGAINDAFVSEFGT
jgi:hypothetical protein